MQKKLSISRLVLYISFFISFLASMNVWFAWNKAGTYINFLVAVVVFICVMAGGIKMDNSRRNLTGFVLLSFAYLYIQFNFGSIKSLFALAGTLYVFYTIICLNSRDKSRALDFITSAFTIMITASLIGWLLNWVIDIPYISVLKNDNDFYDIYYNKVIFVQPTMLGYIYRFSGPFLEPGHLGMMTAFLVYANNFNYKDKRIIVLSVVMLFSLSLAGYVLLAMGYFFTRIINNKGSIKYIAIAALIAVPVYFIGVNYNGGENFLNTLIFQRLEIDDEKGFSGNNRVSSDVDIRYSKLVRQGGYFALTGYGKKQMKIMARHMDTGNGYKLFVITYGFFGLLVVALFYLYYYRKSSQKRYALFFFIFVCAAFWQRTYPFWTSWIMCYVWGLNLYEKLKEQENTSKVKGKLSMVGV